jgi:hypothetical protein
VYTPDPTVLEGLSTTGYVWLPGLLEPHLLGRLGAWVDGLATRPVPKRVGMVRQRADAAVVQARGWDSTIADLVSCLATEIPGSGWVPNEATVMRYRGHDTGITAHRDSRRYVRAIAVVTVSGEARFEILGDRAGKQVIESWLCRAGDVVLLRGLELPGGQSDLEPRPLHRACAPRKDRVSVTLRMDSGV